jgi:hypothetical protein
LQFPFCALGLVLVPIYVKLSTEKTSIGSKLKRIDWIGGFFFIGGMTSFLVGISWAGVQFEWKSAQTIAPMIIGVVSVIAAIVWEYKGAREPFLRPSLFHSTSALATYACALFQGFIVCVFLQHLCFVLAISADKHSTLSSFARSTTFRSTSPPSDSEHQHNLAWTSFLSPASFSLAALSSP